MNLGHVSGYLIFIDLQRNCWHTFILETQGGSEWLRLILIHPHCQESMLGQLPLQAFIPGREMALTPSPFLSDHPTLLAHTLSL